MAALVGCGSDDSGDGGVSAACDQWAAAWCAKEASCTAHAFATTWSSSATCTSRRSALCRARLGAPSTGLRPADMSTCAATIDAIGCEVLSVAATLPACLPKPGQLPNAAACGDDSQCQSAYCRTDGKGSCGTCAVRGGVGKPCNDKADCEGDLACAATSAIKKCAARALAGETCDANRICISPAVCKNGTCVGPAAAGAACDPALKNCDGGAGQYCHANNLVCTAFAVAKAGEPCGYFDGSFVTCAYGSACQLTGQGQGTCEAVGDVGEGCSSGQPQPCRGGLACLGGVCGLPQPQACK